MILILHYIFRPDLIISYILSIIVAYILDNTRQHYNIILYTYLYTYLLFLIIEKSKRVRCSDDEKLKYNILYYLRFADLLLYTFCVHLTDIMISIAYIDHIGTIVIYILYTMVIKRAVSGGETGGGPWYGDRAQAIGREMSCHWPTAVRSILVRRPRRRRRRGATSSFSPHSHAVVDVSL